MSKTVIITHPKMETEGRTHTRTAWVTHTSNSVFTVSVTSRSDIAKVPLRPDVWRHVELLDQLRQT